MKVDLLPLGPVAQELMDHLSRTLSEWGMSCEVLPEVPLPDEAYDPRARQYRAADLLGGLVPRGEDRLLGVTAADIFAEGMDFVFGLAVVGGPTALVSIHRLLDPDEALVRDRLVKESVHELGHTLGLTHCSDAACVMRYSNSVPETDAKGRYLCGTCRGLVAKSMGPLRDD